MKHLFLEGPVQTGKSTLIREALKPYMASEPCFRVGGFASQRLTYSGTDGSDPVTCAFRIGPAMATPLTAPLSDYITSEEVPVFAANGIFKAFAPAAAEAFADNAAFATLGIRYLRDTDGCGLMLLDEIGGQELTCEPFMDALYDLLAGDIPCLGVLKLNANTTNYDPSVPDLNRELRDRIISEYDGEILYYERGDEAVRKQVEDFLSQLFI